MINIINLNKENNSNTSDGTRIYCGRGSIFGNPYTHLDLNKTKALFRCKTREESIEKYNDYYDIMYNGNIAFREAADELYKKYCNGENITLECFCSPEPCHCEIIKKKMEKRLIKERIKLIRNENIV